MKKFSEYILEAKKNFNGWNSIYSLSNMDLLNSIRLSSNISKMQPTLKLNKVKSYVTLTFDSDWLWVFKDNTIDFNEYFLSIGFEKIDIKISKKPVITAYYKDNETKKDEFIGSYTKKWLDDNGITDNGIYKYM